MNDPILDLFDLFPHKRIINLPERTDRRDELVNEFARLGVDPKPLGFEFFPAISVSELNGFPSLGARGCFLSHLTCLKQAVERGHDRILILEDDIALSSAFLHSARNLSTQLQLDDWSFAYFAHENTGVSRARRNDISQFRHWDKPILTAAMFAVQGREMLIALIDFLQSICDPAQAGGRYGPMHVDGAYNEFRGLHPRFMTLISTPLIAWQRPSASDISPNAIETRVPLAKPLFGFVRKVRHALDPNR
jgi:hypothetical protein